MKLRRGLRMSLAALLAHKMRVALAVTSMGIGVAAVLITSAIGQGARDEILRDIASMGTNLIVIRPAQVKRSVAHKEIAGRVTSLRLDDVEAIRTLGVVAAAAPGVDQGMRVKAGAGSVKAVVLGTSPAFFTVRGLRLQAGRFFDPDDDISGSRVAVVGARVGSTLFGERDPVGQMLRVRGIPFEIVGVLVRRGVLADGSDEDGNVFIPCRTALRRVLNTAWLGSIFVSTTGPDRLGDAEAQIRLLLRARHQLAPDAPDDFDIQSQAKLLAMRGKVADSLTVLAAGLAGAALVVGGTGVLALMLLSVKERTGEIGLRMAVGARPRDIFLQFLVEASAIASSGWLVGAALALPAILVLSVTTAWSLSIPVAGIGATLAISLLTGIGFGTLPARKASRLPPVAALRAGS